MESGPKSRLTERVGLRVPDRLLPFEASSVVVSFIGSRSIEVDVEPGPEGKEGKASAERERKGRAERKERGNEPSRDSMH